MKISSHLENVALRVDLDEVADDSRIRVLQLFQFGA